MPCGGVCFPTDKDEGLPHLQALPKAVPTPVQNKKVPGEQVLPSQLPKAGEQSAWGSSKTQEPWVVAGLRLGLLLLVV